MGSEAVSYSVRRLLALLLVVPLALIAVAVFPTSADADIQKYRFQSRGTVVQANDETFDGCVYEYTAVFASESWVDYFSYTYNECTGEESYVTGSAVPSVFQVTKNLSSAHVVATIPLYNDMGEYLGDVLLDNTWTATGSAVRERSSYTTQLPGSFRYTYRSNGTSAPATVTGTIPFSYGSIGKYASLETGFFRS